MLRLVNKIKEIEENPPFVRQGRKSINLFMNKE